MAVKRFVKTALIPAKAGLAVATRNKNWGPSEEKTVQAIFNTLASLKGGPTKLGQVMATFEPTLPEELVGPYKEALAKLTDDVTPVPLNELGPTLKELPPGLQLDKEAFAAASIGQVHRGSMIVDGQKVEVAVKLQYPNMEKILTSDASQIKMLAYAFKKLTGNDITDLATEHINAMLDELDYTLEADAYEKFKAGWVEDPNIKIPAVYYSTEHTLITEYIPAESINTITKTGTADQRNRLGELLLTFTFLNPSLIGLVHADPHPGNFGLTNDNKLRVLDFGSVGIPCGYTTLFVQTAIDLQNNDYQKALEAWKSFGMVSENTSLETFSKVVGARPDPSGQNLYSDDGFTFTPDWLKAQASDYYNPEYAQAAAGSLRLPSAALLEHRAVMGSIALACKLESHVPFNNILHQASQLH